MVERLKLGIEVAQKAVKKSQPDTDNLTHDWEVIISGAAGNISSYVEKVQFNLHESFTNPIRLVSQADEAGAYVCRAAGVTLLASRCFKSKILYFRLCRVSDANQHILSRWQQNTTRGEF